MKLHKPFAISLMLCLFGTAIPLQAEEGDWKVGRIYYRMVCTACHRDHAGGAIPPSNMTKAEWKAYIAADKHAKGKDSVKYYVSQEYRNTIKDTNKAAAKFLKMPDDEMLANVQAFVIHGAKDSDTPARCN
jgi:cytochrome c5